MRNKGFTLLEIIIAISVSSLIFVILSMALRLGYNAVGRGKERGKTFQEVQGTLNLLRRQLLNMEKKIPGEETKTFFQGDGEKLVFLTKMPVEGAFTGGIGVSLLKLDGKDLYLYQKLVTKRDDLEDVEKDSVKFCLIKDVKKFKVSYLEDLNLDGGDIEEEWKDQWDKGGLPLGVKVELSKNKTYGEIFVEIRGLSKR